MNTWNRGVVWVVSAFVLGGGIGLSACESMHRGPSGAGAGQTLLMAPSQAGAGGVGVVRRIDLLIAFTKSAEHERMLKELIARRDAAREAGRGDEVARIEAFGGEMQEVAHRQLAGDEPLYNVMLSVHEELLAIMEARGLSRVLEGGEGVEGVDITDELVRAIESRP